MPDVNVLVYAYRADMLDHARYRRWLEDAISAEPLYAISEQILSSFVRLVTHPRVFRTPTRIEVALAQCNTLRSQPNAVAIVPGDQHWGIFSSLCERVGARGDLIPDAYLAALAIESGCELITTDRDFARFPGLRSRHPLSDSA